MLRNRTPLIQSRLPLVLLTFALLMLLPGLSWAGSTRSFSSGSLDQIAEARSGRPFVLILWSLDCHVCLKELDFLNEQLKLHPDMDLVMVSTDDPNRQGAVEAMLAKHHLDSQVESWIFSEGSVQRLRYAVDPGWYGELPRSYFYDTDHQRVSMSGTVTERHFEGWRSLVRSGEN